MFRTLVCVAVVLTLIPSAVFAQGKGKPHAAIGVIKSVDASAGTITITITNKKGTQDRTFTLTDSTTVTVDGDTPKELKGKDRLTDAGVKEGATIKVAVDAGRTATEIHVGGVYKRGKNK